MLAYILFNSVVIVIASIGNLLVMLAVALNRHLHNMRNFLVSSLALSDFLFATLVLDSRVVSVACRKWIFGEALCHASAFLIRVLYFNTIHHLCAVSYERYRAIVKDPLSYDGRITTKKIILSISVLWILPAVVSLGPFLGFGAFEYNPKVYACGQRWDNETTFPSLVIWFIVPLLFIFVLNFKVIKVARRLERKVHVQLGETNNPGDGQMLQLGQFTNQKGINCQQQDQENIKDGEKRKEHQETSQEIVEGVAGEDPREQCQVNVEDELSDCGAGCSQERFSQHGNIIPAQHWPEAGLHLKSNHDQIMSKEGDPKQMMQAGATEESTCGHFQFPSLSLAERQINTVCSAGVQQRNPEDVSSIAQGGLVKILKECKAARDVLVIIGALLVCFLPMWINSTYYYFKGEPPSSGAIFWVNSLYGTTIICNPIIYSVRKKEFRKAVRKTFKI